MENHTSYTLPLNPVDLANIYKIKADQEDYILHVNYEESKKILSVKHILVYISNTNFKVQFDTIDAELINEYIKCDFLVECPIIARIIALIGKTKLNQEFNNVDTALSTIWPKETIEAYLEENNELIEDLFDKLQHIPLFCISQSTKYDDKFKEFVPEDLDYTDEETNIGLNIVYIATYALDLLYLLGNKFGPWPTSNLNKRLFNDVSKYKGSDLYNTLLKQGVATSMLELFEEES